MEFFSRCKASNKMRRYGIQYFPALANWNSSFNDTKSRAWSSHLRFKRELDTFSFARETIAAEMKKASVSRSIDREDVANLSPGNDVETTERSENEAAREPSFKPWRVFINHVDSYHGGKLVDVSVKFIITRAILLYISLFATAFQWNDRDTISRLDSRPEYSFSSERDTWEISENTYGKIKNIKFLCFTWNTLRLIALITKLLNCKTKIIIKKKKLQSSSLNKFNDVWICRDSVKKKKKKKKKRKFPTTRRFERGYQYVSLPAHPACTSRGIDFELVLAHPL